MKSVFYTGDGFVPVDSGIPNVGRIFAVEPDGALLWYDYVGHGADDLKSWAPNSGNQIGHGWENSKHLAGGGNGMVLAVGPDGKLRWYGYDGAGEKDPTGIKGWSANSGNEIGHGWGDFRNVFTIPRTGHVSPPPAITIYAVDGNGDLHWYSYHGAGEKDPSGTKGWHPNSGNIVGNGWEGFQRIAGAGDVIFAVGPDGSLRWYGYNGNGAADRTGWLPNSGNEIGHGWQQFKHVVGGLTDHTGFGHVLYTVTLNGDMHWYRYNGNGEKDPSGTVGWDPNSSHRIGKGW